MIKIVIGVLIAGLAFHYYPTESHNVTAKAGALVHEGANKLADITQPKSKVEQVVEQITK